jgi:hypothetical protein
VGLNLVIGCRKHRTRRWISRGNEGPGITGFYREHWRCNTDSYPPAIVLSDDQNSDDWLNSELWVEETFAPNWKETA